MLNRRLWLTMLMCCLLALGAAACDDDDDDNGGPGNGEGDAALGGDVVSSIIRNANVAILDAQGEEVATTTTDENGGYFVTIPGDAEGPFALRVTGGQQSRLVRLTPDGNGGVVFEEVPFEGPWYSIIAEDDLLGDDPRLNVTPLTTIAYWAMRAEAAKAGDGTISETLVLDYGDLVEEATKNAFIAGLDTEEGTLGAFSAFNGPLLADDNLGTGEASRQALVSQRMALAIVTGMLTSGEGDEQVDEGSAEYSELLATLGLDLSDGEIDGQVEGFTEEQRLTSLFEMAQITNPDQKLATAEQLFTGVSGSDIQDFVDGLEDILAYESTEILGQDEAVELTIPQLTAESELLASPPAQMLALLQPAVIAVDDQGTVPFNSTSTINIIVLDLKGRDVSADFQDRINAAVVSNGNEPLLDGDLEDATDGPGLEVETLDFAGLEPDNFATVTARLLGTSLEAGTIDDASYVITIAEPGDTPTPAAIASASIDDVDNETKSLLVELTPLGDDVQADNLTATASLFVDNGWFWSGTPDNVSKSLLGQQITTGEPFDINFLAPDNVTSTFIDIRVDLETNRNITGLARQPANNGGLGGDVAQ